jgi:hypothetical protein
MNFIELLEQTISENTTERAFRSHHSSGSNILGGLVTDTGHFHSNHHHDGSWKGRSSEEDCTSCKPAQNKMGRHTRGNSLRSGKSAKGSKSKINKNFRP